jgi:hypothetical protein
VSKVVPTLSEADVEGILLEHHWRLRSTCVNGAVSRPDGAAPERATYSDAILPRLVCGRVRVSEVDCAVAEVA